MSKQPAAMSSPIPVTGPHQNRDGNCWWCGGKTYEDFHGAFASVREVCRCCKGTNIATQGFREFLGIKP